MIARKRVVLIEGVDTIHTRSLEASQGIVIERGDGGDAAGQGDDRSGLEHIGCTFEIAATDRLDLIQRQLGGGANSHAILEEAGGTKVGVGLEVGGGVCHRRVGERAAGCCINTRQLSDGGGICEGDVTGVGGETSQSDHQISGSTGEIDIEVAEGDRANGGVVDRLQLGQIMIAENSDGLAGDIAAGTSVQGCIRGQVDGGVGDGGVGEHTITVRVIDPLQLEE